MGGDSAYIDNSLILTRLESDIGLYQSEQNAPILVDSGRQTLLTLGVSYDNGSYEGVWKLFRNRKPPKEAHKDGVLELKMMDCLCGTQLTKSSC